MKKSNIKKSLLLLVVLIISVIICATSVSAASYPILLPEQVSQDATIGDTVSIKYNYYPEYHNEKIKVYVYDPNNRQIASAEQSFYNSDYDSYVKSYTVTWDTDGKSAGCYTVKAYKYFYTLGSWCEAPSPTTSYIYLKSTTYCANNKHTMRVFETTKEATCTTNGLKSRSCFYCPYKETQTITAPGHKYTTETITAATCTTAGSAKKTCSTCSYSTTVTVPALGHKKSYIIIKAATCTAAGTRTASCSVCGYSGTESYPATGHKADGGKVVKNPTYTVAGQKVYTCTVCKATVKTEAIAKKVVGKVTGLKATSVTESTMKLSWNKVADATKYIVYYSTNGKDWKRVSSTANSATVKKLKAGTTYQIKVCASVSGVNGAVSGVIKAATKVTAAKISSVKSQINANVTVAWKKVTGAAGYEIQYSTSKKFTKKTTKTVTIKKGGTTKATLEGLKNNKKYYVRVKAYNTLNGKAVYGKYSAVKTVTAKATVSISQKSATVYLGRKLTLNLLNSKKSPITSGVKWKTSNKKIATVSKSGVVTAKKAGTAKITATYKDIKFVCEITVKPTVSVNKTKLSFAAGSTEKKAVTVTFKESGSVYWEIVKGADIIDCEWSRKWKNDTTKLYIKPDGSSYGQARVKIYAEDKPSACTYIDVVVEPPISLKVVNKLPCIVGNYESRDYYDEGEKESKVKITNVDYEILYGDSLNIKVEFTAHDSYYDEGYYYFTYRVLDEDGYVVEFDRVMSERMYRGDKAREEIRIYDLEDGNYTIEFLDHYAND